MMTTVYMEYNPEKEWDDVTDYIEQGLDVIDLKHRRYDIASMHLSEELVLIFEYYFSNQTERQSLSIGIYCFINQCFTVNEFED